MNSLTSSFRDSVADAEMPVSISIIEKRASDLTAGERDQWSALCRSDFQYGSPLLTPKFTEFIARIRDDVRVMLAFDGNRLVGVLPVHQRLFGHARPVGAPFCDYSGPLIAQGAEVSIAQMLHRAGYASYRTQTAVVPLVPDSELRQGIGEGSYVIRLKGQSPEAYLETRRGLHPKRFKNFRRLFSKLEREQGGIAFFSGAPLDADLEKLMEWKSDQFRREGLLDLTTAELSREVLDLSIKTPYQTPSEIGGFMTGLRLNGQLIAGHFGVRLDRDFHPWISAFDPNFTEYSPGVLLLSRVIEEMNAMSLETYDLAGGHDFYKKYFADQERFICDLSVSAPTVLGRAQHASFEGWNLLGAKHSESIAGRIRRRIDHAAACESSLGARVEDFLRAVKKRGRSPETVDEAS